MKERRIGKAVFGVFFIKIFNYVKMTLLQTVSSPSPHPPPSYKEQSEKCSLLYTFPKKYFVDFLNLKIVTTFVSLRGFMFNSMDNHAYELTKKIVACYTAIKCKHHAKLQNEKIKKNRIRKKFNKLIIHSNQ